MSISARKQVSRRRFLEVAGGVAGGLAVAQSLGGCSGDASQRTSVGKPLARFEIGPQDRGHTLYGVVLKRCGRPTFQHTRAFMEDGTVAVHQGAPVSGPLVLAMPQLRRDGYVADARIAYGHEVWLVQGNQRVVVPVWHRHMVTQGETYEVVVTDERITHVVATSLYDHDAGVIASEERWAGV